MALTGGPRRADPAFASVLAGLFELEAGGEPPDPSSLPFEAQGPDEPDEPSGADDGLLGTVVYPPEWSRGQEAWDWAQTILDAPEPGASFPGIQRDVVEEDRRRAKADARRYQAPPRVPSMMHPSVVRATATLRGPYLGSVGPREECPEDYKLQWSDRRGKWLVRLVRKAGQRWMTPEEADAYLADALIGPIRYAGSRSKCPECQGFRGVPDYASAVTVERVWYSEAKGKWLVVLPGGRQCWRAEEEIAELERIPSKPCETCSGEGEVVKQVAYREDGVQRIRDRESKREREHSAPSTTEQPAGVGWPSLPEGFDRALMEPPVPESDSMDCQRRGARYVPKGNEKGRGELPRLVARRTRGGLEIVEAPALQRKVVLGDGRVVRGAKEVAHGAKARGGKCKGRYNGSLGGSIAPTGRVRGDREPPRKPVLVFHASEEEVGPSPALRDAQRAWDRQERDRLRVSMAEVSQRHQDEDDEGA